MKRGAIYDSFRIPSHERQFVTGNTAIIMGIFQEFPAPVQSSYVLLTTRILKSHKARLRFHIWFEY